MWQIKIDGFDVDMYDRDKFGSSISYAIADLMQLNVTKGATSKTVKVPATGPNKIFFGTPEDFNAVAKVSQSTKPNTTVYRYGTPVLRGFTKISNTVKNGVVVEYNIVIKGDNGDWRQRIAGKKATELDYSDQDHTLNIATVQASETLTVGREYVYDLIDRGKFSSSQPNGFPVLNSQNVQLYTIPEGIKVDDRYPAIRVPGLVERIFKAQGYRVVSNWLNAAHAQKLTIGFTGRFKHDEDYNDLQKFHATNVLPWSVTVGPSQLSDSRVNSYSQIDSDPSSNYNQFYYYKVPSDGQYKFKAVNIVQPTLYTQSASGTVYVSILKIDAATAALNPFAQGVVVAQTSVPFPSSNTVTLETSLLELDHGDRIMVQTSLYLNASTGNFETVSVAVNSTFECNEVAGELTVQEGQPVNMSVNLPDYFQTDILKGIAHPWKLMFATDVEARVVYIEPYEDFFESTVDPENNWTNLLDTNRPHGTFFIGDQRGREIQLAWKSDSNDKFVDEYNKQNNTLFASAKFDNTNLYAKDSTELVANNLFAPTWMDVCPEAGFMTVRIPRMWSDVTRPKKSTKFLPRIFVYQGITNMPGDEQWAETSDSGTTMRNTYPRFEFYNIDEAGEDNLRFDDTDLASGLLQKQYRNQLKTATEGVGFNGFFKLTDVMISKFDFRKPIYLEVNKTGAYFIVNEIKNYKPDVQDSTEVELLKIFGKTPKTLLKRIKNTLAAPTVQVGPQVPVSVSIVTVVTRDARSSDDTAYQSMRYNGEEFLRVQNGQIMAGGRGSNVYVNLDGVIHQVYIQDDNGNVQPVTT